MYLLHRFLRFLPIVAGTAATLALCAACGGGGHGDSATSTPRPGVAASALASSPAASGAALEISTASGIQYDKTELGASAGAQVTVKYTNNSTVSHNIDFTSGSDANAPSLAATKIAEGPNNVQTITFTAPTKPGSYFFHCDVHPDQMNGHLVVR